MVNDVKEVKCSDVELPCLVIEEQVVESRLLLACQGYRAFELVLILRQAILILELTRYTTLDYRHDLSPDEDG